MSDQNPPTASASASTAWSRNLATPLRDFLRAETGSAAILLVAAVETVDRRREKKANQPV